MPRPRTFQGTGAAESAGLVAQQLPGQLVKPPHLARMLVEEAWLRRQMHSLPHPDDGTGAGDEDPRPVPGERFEGARGPWGRTHS